MKNVLSLILVVFMLFSIMSLSALATDEENVTDVSNDFAEMEDEEIEIEDVEFDFRLPVNAV